MSLSYEIEGQLVVKEDSVHISDRFTKREFVIEVENARNPDWNDFIKLQLTQDRCDLIENIAIGSKIKAHFNIKGRKWEKDDKVNYFNSLEAWKIEVMEEGKGEAAPVSGPTEEETDDLPF